MPKKTVYTTPTRFRSFGHFRNSLSSANALYVLLGMTAMMAAILQAPLFALMAVLELTANPNIILPAMLIIVVATMTMSQLEALGLEYPPSPLAQHLLRTSVENVMSRNHLVLDPGTNTGEVCQLMKTDTVTGKPIPEWISVASEPTGDTSILITEDLLRASNGNVPTSLTLNEMPQLTKELPHVDTRSTLAEALSKLDHVGTEILCVRRATNKTVGPIVGVLNRHHISKHTALTQQSVIGQ